MTRTLAAMVARGRLVPKDSCTSADTTEELVPSSAAVIQDLRADEGVAAQLLQLE